jgi:hypothetical protein
MKVTGPGSPNPASKARRKGASQGAGAAFAPESAAPKTSAGAAAGVSGTGGVNSVDALLALQDMGDLGEARRQASQRAHSLLDVLDDLKIALLEGGLPPAKLNTLMKLLQSRREATGDPKLERALDDIETRAAVELAKHQA